MAALADTMAALGAAGTEHDRAVYRRRCLAMIERDTAGAGNRTRHAMNDAQIAIAVTNDRLRAAALAAARRIGPGPLRPRS
jgi:hypothetical protein